MIRSILRAAGVAACVGLSSSVAAQATDSGGPLSPLADLPVPIIENHGVYPDDVEFFVDAGKKRLFFSPGGVTFALRDGDRNWAVQLDFVGARHVVPVGERRRPGVISYFRGSLADTRPGLATFGAIRYRDLWPGIDLVYRGASRTVKYDVIVRPGADPSVIRFRYRGATRCSIDSAGGLRIETGAGNLTDDAPIAFQRKGLQREAVHCAWRTVDRDFTTFGFRVGAYDAERTLVIDPAVFVYCGYLGGSGHEWPHDIAVDAQGYVYVTGTTDSNPQTFPLKVGPFLTKPSTQAAFVAKVDPSGRTLVYCGYIAGAQSTDGSGIAVDAQGRAYVSGDTTSDERSFPVRVGPSLRFSGLTDVFVARVNAAGTALDYCGYIGGTRTDTTARSIAVDHLGAAYVCGTSTADSIGFPVKIGPSLRVLGNQDAFVARVSPSGAQLDYCGYIGGLRHDIGFDIAVDAQRNAYVAGETSSDHASFPVRGGPVLRLTALQDGFVAKVNSAGTALDYCGYVGGAERITGIDVDRYGRVGITGYTGRDEQSFPVRVGPSVAFGGGSRDCFVAGINATGAYDFCGYIGGDSSDFGFDCAFGPAGELVVYGYTVSTPATVPVRLNPRPAGIGLRAMPGTPPWRGFLASVQPSGRGLYYVGYVPVLQQPRIAVDRLGDVYFAGQADSSTALPLMVGPDLTHNGQGDVALAKLSVGPIAFGAPCNGNARLATTPWRIGQRYVATISGAPPSKQGILVLTIVPSAPLEVVPGCHVEIDPAGVIAAVPLVSDAAGNATFADTIAANPALEGATLVVQSVFFPVASPPGFATSDALLIAVKQ